MFEGKGLRRLTLSLVLFDDAEVTVDVGRGGGGEPDAVEALNDPLQRRLQPQAGVAEETEGGQYS